jgi:hypothetical protein
MNVIFEDIIKKVNHLVDVSPHWGEPRTYGVLWFSLCNVISIMFFMVLRLECIMNMHVFLKCLAYILDLIQSAMC